MGENRESAAREVRGRVLERGESAFSTKDLTQNPFHARAQYGINNRCGPRCKEPAATTVVLFGEGDHCRDSNANGLNLKDFMGADGKVQHP